MTRICGLTVTLITVPAARNTTCGVLRQVPSCCITERLCTHMPACPLPMCVCVYASALLLAPAVCSLNEKGLFDYLLVNEDLSTTAAELERIAQVRERIAFLHCREGHLCTVWWPGMLCQGMLCCLPAFLAGHCASAPLSQPLEVSSTCIRMLFAALAGVPVVVRRRLPQWNGCCCWRRPFRLLTHP